MPTTPNGLPYPGNPASEPPNGPQQIGALAQAADAKVVGQFVTSAARDATITAPVVGQMAMTGRLPRVFTGTSWAPLNAGMRAQRNADAPLGNGTWTAFAANSGWGEVDTYGMRSTGATWVAPWDGWYHLVATLYFAPNETGTRGMRLVPLDGQGIGEGPGQPYEIAIVPASGGGNSTTITGSHITNLEKGQRVQLQGYQNSGGSLIVRSVRISAMFSLT